MPQLKPGTNKQTNLKKNNYNLFLYMLKFSIEHLYRDIGSIQIHKQLPKRKFQHDRDADSSQNNNKFNSKQNVSRAECYLIDWFYNSKVTHIDRGWGEQIRITKNLEK